MTYYKMVDGEKIRLTEDETQEFLAKTSDSSFDAQSMRRMRDQLISETDWWATSDRTMTAEQTAYRQALRDITDQSGFPIDITWPTKPE